MSRKKLCFSTLAAAALLVALPAAADSTVVNSDNFVRAESDLYFSAVVATDRFGKFGHDREMTALDNQAIIRLNRDTLYSSAVFDLDAGPVTPEDWNYMVRLYRPDARILDGSWNFPVAEEVK